MYNKDLVPLLVAVVSLIASIITFILPPDGHRNIKIIIGVVFLFVAIILGAWGTSLLVLNSVQVQIGGELPTPETASKSIDMPLTPAQLPTSEPELIIPDTPTSVLLIQTEQLPTPMSTKMIPSAATTIERTEVDALRKGEVSKEQVEDCLATVHAGPRPYYSFTSDQQIPAGVLVATNYGEAETTWQEFPVTPICHLASWGLFETTGSYTAPYEGAYWTIIERPTINNVTPIVCVPDGVAGHETANPLYKLPTGYRSGWITSDSSDLILPDGTTTTISERYVLFVVDVAEIQIRNVAMGSEHSNTWGCWFREDLADGVLPAAEEELQKMKAEAPTIATGLYKLDPNGLTKLDAGTACIAKERGPLTQSDHFLDGPLHVVQLWRANGNSQWGQGEVMALLYGDVSIVAAGGNVWTYPTQDCARGAEVDMQSSAAIRNATIVAADELRTEGLIK